MSMPSLVGFYTDLLRSLHIEDVGEGKLSLVLPGDEGDQTTQPCVSNDKRLTLPTKHLLKSGQWNGLLAFHPLSENLIRGESEVIKFLRKIVRFQLASVASQLLTELMDIAANPERHQELKPKQAEYLKTVPNANEKCVKALSKVLEKHFDQLINVYLKRSGTLNGQEYRRVAAVSFPIWDEMSTTGSKIYDVDCGSVKNKKTIASLFEYVFPNPDDLDAWSAASNDSVAPYFHSLVLCYGNIAKHLNGLIHRYRKHLDYPDLLKVNLDWMDDLHNLQKWKTSIPSLPGNEGAVMRGEKEVSEPGPSKPHPQHAHFKPPVAGVAQVSSTEAPEVEDTPPWEDIPQVSAPAAAAKQAPADADTGRGVDWRSFRSTMASAPAPFATQPTGPYGAPQQPMAPQPMPYGAPPQQSHASFQYGGGGYPQQPVQHPYGAPQPAPMGYGGRPAMYGGSL